MSPRGQLLYDVAYQLGLEFIHPIQPTYHPDAGYAPDVLDFLSTILYTVILLKFYEDLVRTIHYPVMFRPQERLIKYPLSWKTYAMKL
jgi:hypothetical protein